MPVSILVPMIYSAQRGTYLLFLKHSSDAFVSDICFVLLEEFSTENVKRIAGDEHSLCFGLANVF